MSLKKILFSNKKIKLFINFIDFYVVIIFPLVNCIFNDKFFFSYEIGQNI